jgi:hypothetical protein
MGHGSRASSWLCAAALTACNSLPAQADRPALIASATPETRAELIAALEQALGEREIMLAPDALTRTSVLTLESGIGGAARGRDLGMPERFDLVLSGERCFLVHARTDRRFELERSGCVPAEP